MSDDARAENPPMPMGNKLFSITNDDLLELERIIPAIVERHMLMCNDTRTRKQLDKVKQILSNVRWDYGPPLEVHTLPAGDLP